MLRSSTQVDWLLGSTPQTELIDVRRGEASPINRPMVAPACISHPVIDSCTESSPLLIEDYALQSQAVDDVRPTRSK